MSKEKHIEEMAKHCPCYFGEKCCIDGELPEKCDMLCQFGTYAEILYTAGYRKQSEVAREIEKFEQQVGKIYNRYVFEDTDYADDDVAIEAVINALTDVLNDLADFKKKYTEGENGTK